MMTETELRPLLGRKAIVRVRSEGRESSRIARVFRNPDGFYRVVSPTRPKAVVSVGEILAVTPITAR